MTAMVSVSLQFEPLLSDTQAGDLLGLHPKTVQILAELVTSLPSASAVIGNSARVNSTSGLKPLPQARGSPVLSW